MSSNIRLGPGVTTLHEQMYQLLRDGKIGMWKERRKREELGKARHSIRSQSSYLYRPLPNLSSYTRRNARSGKFAHLHLMSDFLKLERKLFSSVLATPVSGLITSPTRDRGLSSHVLIVISF